MRNTIAAFAAVLALACPALATVTGNPPPTVYSCTGAATTFTIGFPYLAASHVVATVTTAGGAVTTLALTTDYTVRPSTAPSTGTLTLTSACASGSTLTISRAVPATQPQSFRTGSYQGAPHEQAFDRLEMQIQDTRAMQAVRDAAQDTTFAASLAAAAATQATRDSTQDAALSAFITTQSARDAAQNLALAQGAIGGSSTMVVPTGTSFGRTLADTFADQVSVRSFTGVTGNGTTDDSAGILAACNATVGRRLYFPAGTYRISTVMVCNSGTVWFESGAQLSIDSAKSFTASGRVVSLGGDPATGAGTMIYSKDGNFFANDFGFSFSKTPSTGTDDFFHIRRDIAGSTGIIIRNDDITGSLTDSYIHLYGGPLTGVNQGANLRFSAGNLLNNGGLVNIVAQNDAAFSLINLASTPLDLYTAGVRQLQIASVPSAVNYWQFKGGLAASSVSLVPAGTDTNISAIYNTKGTGSMFFRTGATPAFQMEVFDTAGATNRVRVTGGTNPTITTSAGNLAVAAPLMIGASGTAISASFRGTTTSVPGTVPGNSCLSSAGITVTGAVAGADCMVGNSAGATGLSVTCSVTLTNVCALQFCNSTTSPITPTAGTYSCRVLNP